MVVVYTLIFFFEKKHKPGGASLLARDAFYDGGKTKVYRFLAKTFCKFREFLDPKSSI